MTSMAIEGREAVHAFVEHEHDELAAGIDRIHDAACDLTGLPASEIVVRVGDVLRLSGAALDRSRRSITVPASECAGGTPWQRASAVGIARSPSPSSSAPIGWTSDTGRGAGGRRSPLRPHPRSAVVPAVRRGAVACSRRSSKRGRGAASEIAIGACAAGAPERAMPPSLLSAAPPRRGCRAADWAVGSLTIPDLRTRRPGRIPGGASAPPRRSSITIRRRSTV